MSETLRLINELIKSIVLAQSRGAYKLVESSYIQSVILDLQKQLEARKPLSTINEDMVINDEQIDI